MTETLYIRLASRSQDVVHWLIHSAENQEIIASGELKDAAELIQLSEKAKTRQVIVLVPSCDVILKRLTVPGNSQRAIRMAAPYMLEDDLAQDVEQLFFAYANMKTDEQGHNCFVAIVERTQLNQWQSWLKEANINCKKMLPEVLALPNATPHWAAITLEQQLLLRQGNWQGMTIDLAVWPIVEASLAKQLKAQQGDDNEQLPVIDTYSPLSSQHFTLNAQPEELPLALLAKHAPSQNFNLLQGEYQVKQTRSPIIQTWLSVAAIAVIALIFSLTFKAIKLHQLNNQIAQVEADIIQVYKKAFPKTKRVKAATVRSQLKRKLAEIGSVNHEGNFLAFLDKLHPAFVAVPELKPEAIKFDQKRQELRLQATASDYQYFEKFKNQLEKTQFTVSQGSLNNQGDLVSGSFSIKDK